MDARRASEVLGRSSEGFAGLLARSDDRRARRLLEPAMHADAAHDARSKTFATTFALPVQRVASAAVVGRPELSAAPGPP